MLWRRPTSSSESWRQGTACSRGLVTLEKIGDGKDFADYHGRYRSQSTTGVQNLSLWGTLVMSSLSSVHQLVARVFVNITTVNIVVTVNTVTPLTPPPR